MRTKINWILGGLIALLAGCKAPQEAAPTASKAERVSVLYGPPSVFMQAAQEQDSVRAEKNKLQPLEIGTEDVQAKGK